MTEATSQQTDKSSTEEPTGAAQDAYTVNEFAARWRLTPDTIYTLIKLGRLPAVRITNRGVRILRAGEQAWLETFVDAREPWPEQQTTNEQ
jgi:excisionase family DNA binding protein